MNQMEEQLEKITHYLIEEIVSEAEVDKQRDSTSLPTNVLNSNRQKAAIEPSGDCY